MKCKRTTHDPLLKAFLDRYSIHLLPVARQSVNAGDVIVNDGRSASAPGNIDGLLTKPLKPKWTSTNEVMSTISGVLSSAVDMKYSANILEKFLGSIGVSNVPVSLKAAYEGKEKLLFRFAFDNPLRDSMDAVAFGARLTKVKIVENHPLWNSDYSYYFVSAAIKSSSITMVTETENGDKVDLNMKALQALEFNGKISVQKNKKGTIRFSGSTPLSFGMELYEFTVKKETGDIRILLPPGAVQTKAGKNSPGPDSIIKPAIIGGADGNLFLENLKFTESH